MSGPPFHVCGAASALPRPTHTTPPVGGPCSAQRRFSTPLRPCCCTSSAAGSQPPHNPMPGGAASSWLCDTVVSFPWEGCGAQTSSFHHHKPARPSSRCTNVRHLQAMSSSCPIAPTGGPHLRHQLRHHAATSPKSPIPLHTPPRLTTTTLITVMFACHRIQVLNYCEPLHTATQSAKKKKTSLSHPRCMLLL